MSRKYGISPVVLSRWKKEYGECKFFENSNPDNTRLEIRLCELEQMVGKLTMENYLLKKEKEFIARAKKESSSIVTGTNLDQYRRHAD